MAQHRFSITPLIGVAIIATLMVTIVGFHLGNSLAHTLGQFSPLIGAIVGGFLILFCTSVPPARHEHIEPWLGLERWGWQIIGWGIVMWGVGESFWRYYVANGQSPFPSMADSGYTLFPLLVFIGLLLQPASDTKGRRIFLLLDSLIAMGSILSIGWFLLLGSLAQTPGEANLGKFLGLYYPISDIALLSCAAFLLLRGSNSRIYQTTARRLSLIAIVVGLLFFVGSDFNFNIQQNINTYVEATILDLGWPLGLMMIGIAAYLRRFLPPTSEQIIAERQKRGASRQTLELSQYIPYLLLCILFFVLLLNTLSNNAASQAIRPVLVGSTLVVTIMVVIRQILTLQENALLTRRQEEGLINLQNAYTRIEYQAEQITEHNHELEQGINHLKEVQARLANGDLGVRATLTKGTLLPLAISLNLMAERLMAQVKASTYTQRLAKALNDLAFSLERYRPGIAFDLPTSCNGIVEINRLLVALGQIGIIAPSTLSAFQEKNVPREAYPSPIEQFPAFPPVPPASKEKEKEQYRRSNYLPRTIRTEPLRGNERNPSGPTTPFPGSEQEK
jgi:hypothetical protein